MQLTTYSEIFNQHSGKVSDKWTSYLPFYDEITRGFDPKRILEIGVQNGGSLEIWGALYPEAEAIIGIDIDEKCRSLNFTQANISVFIGDAKSQTVFSQISQSNKLFDLIVDDGSHSSPDIIGALVRYLPLLNPGGKYVIEDLHAAYWQNWGGGLFEPNSAISFLKKLIDSLNLEHWDEDVNLREYLIAAHDAPEAFFEAVPRIKMISFQNSMCLIQISGNSDQISVGTRKIVGNIADVTLNPHQYDGLPILGMVQKKTINNFDSKRSMNPIDEADLIRRNRLLIAERDALLKSWSWRLTSPIRRIIQIFR